MSVSTSRITRRYSTAAAIYTPSGEKTGGREQRYCSEKSMAVLLQRARRHTAPSPMCARCHRLPPERPQGLRLLILQLSGPALHLVRDSADHSMEIGDRSIRNSWIGVVSPYVYQFETMHSYWCCSAVALDAVHTLQVPQSPVCAPLPLPLVLLPPHAALTPSWTEGPAARQSCAGSPIRHNRRLFGTHPQCSCCACGRLQGWTCVSAPN